MFPRGRLSPARRNRKAPFMSPSMSESDDSSLPDSLSLAGELGGKAMSGGFGGRFSDELCDAALCQYLDVLNESSSYMIHYFQLMLTFY